MDGTTKCDISGILYGCGAKPADWAMLAPLLQHITINSEPVGKIKPGEPFRYLDVDLTLTLLWQHQYAQAEAAIKEAGESLAKSPAGKRPTVGIEESNVLSKLMYPCCLTPYTRRQVKQLDMMRATVLKKILKLPTSMSTDQLYLPKNKLGFQMKSMVPAYVQKTAESLILAHEDKGQLGLVR